MLRDHVPSPSSWNWLKTRVRKASRACERSLRSRLYLTLVSARTRTGRSASPAAARRNRLGGQRGECVGSTRREVSIDDPPTTGVYPELILRRRGLRDERGKTGVGSVKIQVQWGDILEHPSAAVGVEEILTRSAPRAQVKEPPLTSPCEKRLVAFACKESYLLFQVGDRVGSTAPNCGKNRAPLYYSDLACMSRRNWAKLGGEIGVGSWESGDRSQESGMRSRKTEGRVRLPT
jgi:hypothetical protein